MGRQIGEAPLSVAYDFSGKTIVPLAASGGSGLGKAPQRMQALATGAKVLGGDAVTLTISAAR